MAVAVLNKFNCTMHNGVSRRSRSRLALRQVGWAVGRKSDLDLEFEDEAQVGVGVGSCKLRA